MDYYYRFGGALFLPDEGQDNRLRSVGRFTRSQLFTLNYGRGDSCPSGNYVVTALALVRSCLGPSPYSAHVPSFPISYYSITIIRVSAPTSYFILVVPMREVYCVG